MVMVYRARVKDANRAEMTITQHKGTAEWIAKLPGEIIYDTGEEVDISEIDAQGRYIPQGKPE